MASIAASGVPIASAAVGPYFKPEHYGKTFETGLEIVLDGIAKEAKRAAMR